MSWFHVDDKFHGHPKVLDASEAGIGAWTKIGSWCALHGTDGKIPLSAARKLCTKKGIADAIAVRLLLDHGDTLEVSGYLDCNPSASQVAARREAWAEKKKGQRGRMSPGDSNGDTQPCPPGSPPDVPEPVPRGVLTGVARTPAPAPAPATAGDPDPDPPNPPAGGHGSGDVGQGALPGMGTSPPPPPAEAKPRKPPRARRDPDQPTADQRYRGAIERGVRAGAPGEAFALPAGKVSAILGPVLQVHAVRDGAPLVGEELDAWIERETCAWRRAADPNFAGGWRPAKFIDWLNAGRPAARSTQGPATLQRPAKPGEFQWKRTEGA